MEVSGRRQDNKGKPLYGDIRIFCQPCSSDGDIVAAVGYCQNCKKYLCSVCLKVHRKQAVSRNHNILDGDNMPKVTLPKVSLNACSDICPKHVNEIIKYYCSSHDVVGCGDCMVIDHKSCKVDRIHDISTQYFNGTEHKFIRKKIFHFVKCMDKIKKDIQVNEKNTKQANEKAVKNVRKFKKEIVDFLDKEEKELLCLIANREERDNRRQMKLKQDEKHFYDYIRELQTNLHQQQKQANKLFVEAKQVKAKLSSIEEYIEHLKEEATIDVYEFRRSSSLSQIIDSGVKLGEILLLTGDTRTARGKGTSKEQFGKPAISKMDAYFDSDINIKLPGDDSDCAVYDCTLINQNQLVVTDYCNTCIKVVDMKNKTVSKYKLRSKPNGVAVVNSGLIAVTLQSKDQIQFLSITAGNEINQSNMIKVDKGCEKITIYEDKIIGITRNSVEIMSMSGQNIKSVYHPKLTWLMDISVEPSSHMFYVSNGLARNAFTSAVYKFDFYGNLIATYMDVELVDVRGLEVTRDGTLLACSWKNDGSIHMITPDCKKTNELLKQSDHVHYPWCVAFCNETNKLYLANSYYLLDSKMTNVLKVFQLK